MPPAVATVAWTSHAVVGGANASIHWNAGTENTPSATAPWICMPLTSSVALVAASGRSPHGSLGPGRRSGGRGEPARSTSALPRNGPIANGTPAPSTTRPAPAMKPSPSSAPRAVAIAPPAVAITPTTNVAMFGLTERVIATSCSMMSSLAHSSGSTNFSRPSSAMAIVGGRAVGSPLASWRIAPGRIVSTSLVT